MNVNSAFIFKATNINPVLIVLVVYPSMVIDVYQEESTTCPYLVTLVYQGDFTLLTIAMSALVDSVTKSKIR
jgi:hypothetical protein